MCVICWMAVQHSWTTVRGDPNRWLCVCVCWLSSWTGRRGDTEAQSRTKPLSRASSLILDCSVNIATSHIIITFGWDKQCLYVCAVIVHKLNLTWHYSAIDSELIWQTDMHTTQTHTQTHTNTLSLSLSLWWCEQTITSTDIEREREQQYCTDMIISAEHDTQHHSLIQTRILHNVTNAHKHTHVLYSYTRELTD